MSLRFSRQVLIKCLAVGGSKEGSELEWFLARKKIFTIGGNDFVHGME